MSPRHISTLPPTHEPQMIYYSVDTEPRAKVFFLAAGAALGVSLLIPQYVANVTEKTLIPSAFALYGLILLTFDRFLWKLKPFSWLAGIPDLTGRYSGTVTTLPSDSSPESTQTAEVSIKQTWLKIEMTLRTELTISHLTLCGFQVEDDESLQMLATYLVCERRPIKGKNSYGEGTQTLLVKKTKNLVLSGQYYSTKHRGGYVDIKRADA